MIKPTQFTALAAVTLATMAAAAILHATSTRWSTGGVEGRAALPELPRQIGQIGAIEMRQGEDVLTLERHGDRWQLKERGGYPVAAEKARALVLQLADAKLIEPKTALKDRHALLELDDPATKGAKSRLVRVLDAKSKVLSEIVVGKSRTDAFGAGRGGFYMRAPGATQTWLASGAPRISTATRDWVDTQIFKGEAAKLKRIVIEAAGAAPLVIEKGSEADAKFALTKIPDGKKVKQTAGIEQLPAAFTSIDMEDVRKLDATPAGEGVKTVRIEGSDGLVVTFRLRREKGKEGAQEAAWMSLTATGEGEAKKSADAVNAKGAGWEFRIPTWKADQMGKSEADLFEAAS